MTSDRQLELVTRRRCHLCDLVRPQLAELAAVAGLELAELDVDDDPQLQRLYGDRVPVLLSAGQLVAEGRFDPVAVLGGRTLKALSRASHDPVTAAGQGQIPT